MPAREKGGSCPRCKTLLARDTIGGRTTYWCPRCQPD
jgi:formamidopyrimidine-DNA glycosylase